MGSQWPDLRNHLGNLILGTPAEKLYNVRRRQRLTSTATTYSSSMWNPLSQTGNPLVLGAAQTRAKGLLQLHGVNRNRMECSSACLLFLFILFFLMLPDAMMLFALIKTK